MNKVLAITGIVLGTMAVGAAIAVIIVVNDIME